jgi:hypothetical protein
LARLGLTSWLVLHIHINNKNLFASEPTNLSRPILQTLGFCSKPLQSIHFRFSFLLSNLSLPLQFSSVKRPAAQLSPAQTRSTWVAQRKKRGERNADLSPPFPYSPFFLSRLLILPSWPSHLAKGPSVRPSAGTHQEVRTSKTFSPLRRVGSVVNGIYVQDCRRGCLPCPKSSFWGGGCGVWRRKRFGRVYNSVLGFCCCWCWCWCCWCWYVRHHHPLPSSPQRERETHREREIQTNLFLPSLFPPPRNQAPTQTLSLSVSLLCSLSTLAPPRSEKGCSPFHTATTQNLHLFLIPASIHGHG